MSHPWHDDIKPVPMDEAALRAPSFDDALATAGALIHWATSDPALAAGFARWLEHCPGDLSPRLVCEVLAATHDVLAPGCPDAIVIPTFPDQQQ